MLRRSGNEVIREPGPVPSIRAGGGRQGSHSQWARVAHGGADGVRPSDGKVGLCQCSKGKCYLTHWPSFCRHFQHNCYE